MLLVVDTGTLAAIYTQNFLDLKPAKYDISNFIRIAITSTYLKFGQSCAIGKKAPVWENTNFDLI